MERLLLLSRDALRLLLRDSRTAGDAPPRGDLDALRSTSLMFVPRNPYLKTKNAWHEIVDTKTTLTDEAFMKGKG